VALVDFMRLSLMKGVHANLSSTAWQKSGSSPVLAAPPVPACRGACRGARVGYQSTRRVFFVIRSSRLVWQVEKALTDPKIAMDARPGGRSSKCERSPEGLEINPEDDLPAVGKVGVIFKR
jgi:hypothetical protein